MTTRMNTEWTTFLCGSYFTTPGGALATSDINSRGLRPQQPGPADSLFRLCLTFGWGFFSALIQRCISSVFNHCNRNRHARYPGCVVCFHTLANSVDRERNS